MPARATVGANLRILRGETTGTAFARLQKNIADPRVEMRLVRGIKPSAVAGIKTGAWNDVELSVSETWPGAIVSPYLMVACTDSRHYGKPCDTVLRFSAMELTTEERATMHAASERIQTAKLPGTCAFFYRLAGRR